jgi:ubiquinone/menaquinone biosynthesis C-methylase UbiE
MHRQLARHLTGMTTSAERNASPAAHGIILRSATMYDLLAWLFTRGRERAFRENVVRLARLDVGERVLDVGCGTGTLAIAAKRRVGPMGTVHGVDASPELIARASRKARKAGVEVGFQNALVQALPFPDAQFNAVLNTLMLHHLPADARRQCAHEMRRVLKPSGRVLVVDFAKAPRGLLAHFHRQGHVKPDDIIGVMGEAGLNVVESGAVGFRDLQFVLATANGATRGKDR